MSIWFVNENMPASITTNRRGCRFPIRESAYPGRWRNHRGLSQLDLATAVGSTARHLSFLETGRSRPSRHMVLRLGEALGVSLRERNHLLHAAGLPGA